MRVEFNEEVKQFGTEKNDYIKNEKSQTAAFSKEYEKGAVFESGEFAQYIENAQLEKTQDSVAAESSEAKQMQNYLNSLSNTMSEEDFEELQKETKEPKEEEIETIVTVQERIKARLAAYCEDYEAVMLDEFSEAELSQLAGFPDNVAVFATKLKQADLPVTKENLEQIQQALSMAGELQELPEGVKQYFIKYPSKEMTIENLYLAMYSTGINHTVSNQTGNYYSKMEGGYVTQNTTAIQWETYLPQINNFLLEAGIPVDEQSMNRAKWLVENQLPLNKETMERVEQLEQIQFPLEENIVVDKLIESIVAGKAPIHTDVTSVLDEGYIEKGKELVTFLQNVTDEQLRAVIAKNGEYVSIEGLREVTEDDTVSINVLTIEETDIRLVSARRQLEEIRLQMTIEAAALMNKNGIDVETQSLSDLVENLKELENQYYARRLTTAGVAATEENITVYKQVTQAVDFLKTAPAAVLGESVQSADKQTLEALFEEGKLQDQKFKEAESVYETLMTKPRADMGDSIQTAFRNVDDILKEMQLDVTLYNQRAVRILGYNNMEITLENIEQVKQLDLEVNTMLERMTPSNVLKMIREEFNPLNASVYEINEVLSSYEENSFLTEEKYSEFLWKLEQQNGITPEERESYVGIYRLLKQIEKSDGALVGALISQGAELTMKNLLSGMRTRKHGQMDYSVDDAFAGVDGKQQSGKKIDDQIESVFSKENAINKKLAGQALQHMNIQALTGQSFDTTVNMTLEQFAEYMQDSVEDPYLQKAYYEEQLNDFRQLTNMEQEVLKLLSDYDMPMNYHYLTAARELLQQPSGWLKRWMNEKAEQNETTWFEEQSASLLNSLGDKDTVLDHYESFLAECERMMRQEAVQEKEAYLDVTEMKLRTAQIQLSVAFAKEEHYQIPVRVGEELTAINLTFKHSLQEEQQVTISMELELYGKVEAQFGVENNMVKGYVVCSRSEGKAAIQSLEKEFAASLSIETTLQLGTISYVETEQFSYSEVFKKGAGESVTSSQLYRVAKAFISAFQYVK